jgi:nitrogen regulatory protein P-II 1
MKLMVAIIPPERLQAVQTALNQQDVHSMTVSEVLDCRHDHATSEIYRGRTIRRPATKLRLEVAVEDWNFDATVELIERASACPQASEEGAFVIGHDECFYIPPYKRSTAVTGV